MNWPLRTDWPFKMKWPLRHTCGITTRLRSHYGQLSFFTCFENRNGNLHHISICCEVFHRGKPSDSNMLGKTPNIITVLGPLSQTHRRKMITAIGLWPMNCPLMSSLQYVHTLYKQRLLASNRLPWNKEWEPSLNIAQNSKGKTCVQFWPCRHINLHFLPNAPTKQKKVGHEHSSH